MNIAGRDQVHCMHVSQYSHGSDLIVLMQAPMLMFNSQHVMATAHSVNNAWQCFYGACNCQTSNRDCIHPRAAV